MVGVLVCGWDACVWWGGVCVVGGSRGRERYSPAPSSEIDNLSYSSSPSDATCSCGPWGSSPRCWSAPRKTPSWTWRSRGKARRRWTHRRSAAEGVPHCGLAGNDNLSEAVSVHASLDVRPADFGGGANLQSTTNYLLPE